MAIDASMGGAPYAGGGAGDSEGGLLEVVRLLVQGGIRKLCRGWWRGDSIGSGSGG